jgi:hypothetical protein
MLKLAALVYSNTWRHFHSLLVYSIMLLTTYVTLNDRTTGEGPGICLEGWKKIVKKTSVKVAVLWTKI